nr:hypothetical protein [Rubricella aquisinus]
MGISTVKVNTATVRSFDSLPASQQAGMLPNDRQFRRFVAVRLGLTRSRDVEVSATAAAEYIRRTCGVESRRSLNSNPTAVATFQAMRTDFDAWAGRIAQPR